MIKYYKNNYFCSGRAPSMLNTKHGLTQFIASGSDFVQTDVAELVIKYLDGKGLR